MTKSMTNCEGVILLHGLWRSSLSMEKMAASLANSGFLVENINYPSLSQTIDSLSDSAIGKALNSPNLQKCSKIHFVTHSLGGILVRCYFNQHKCDRLSRVVMLGPPNKGSEVIDNLKSWWFFKIIIGSAGLELGTDFYSTPNTLGAVEFELGIIAGDRSINWINSLMIKGEDDGKVSVERTKVAGMKDHVIVHCPHSYLMNNKTAIEYTLQFLKEGFFTPRLAIGHLHPDV